MKVLLATDITIDRAPLASILSGWGHEIVEAADSAGAEAALEEPDPAEVVLVDCCSPQLDGLEFCRRLRRRMEPKPYILLLIDRCSQGELAAAFEADVDDCLRQPFEPLELKLRLQLSNRILALQQALLDSEERLHAEATQDPLTGLPNQAQIRQLLEKELHRSRREGLPICLAIADMDRFREINHTIGHLTGDVVLAEVARRLVLSVRPYDWVGRGSGDEFVTVLPGSRPESGMRVVDRRRSRVSHRPIETSAGNVQPTVSLGLATFVDNPSTNVEAMIRVAEEALSRAKQLGRNRVEMALVEGVSV